MTVHAWLLLGRRQDGTAQCWVPNQGSLGFKLNKPNKPPNRVPCKDFGSHCCIIVCHHRQSFLQARSTMTTTMARGPSGTFTCCHITILTNSVPLLFSSQLQRAKVLSSAL